MLSFIMIKLFNLDGFGMCNSISVLFSINFVCANFGRFSFQSSKFGRYSDPNNKSLLNKCPNNVQYFIHFSQMLGIVQ